MNPRLKKLLIILLAMVLAGLLIYILGTGQQHFSHHSIRSFQRNIRSFGAFSPLSVLALIILSTLIPPLPLPVPLIEITAGLVFGFGEAVVLIWLSQIISSVVAFRAGRFFHKRFFKKSPKAKWVKVYRGYLHKSGPWAVGITRATMASPFNIISYLAGLSHMSLKDFLVATSLGVIPESLLFAFVGSEIRTLKFNLWYLFVGLALLGVVGFFSSFILIRVVQSQNRSSKS